MIVNDNPRSVHSAKVSHMLKICKIKRKVLVYEININKTTTWYNMAVNLAKICVLEQNAGET